MTRIVLIDSMNLNFWTFLSCVNTWTHITALCINAWIYIKPSEWPQEQNAPLCRPDDIWRLPSWINPEATNVELILLKNVLFTQEPSASLSPSEHSRHCLVVSGLQTPWNPLINLCHSFLDKASWRFVSLVNKSHSLFLEIILRKILSLNLAKCG